MKERFTEWILQRYVHRDENWEMLFEEDEKRDLLSEEKGVGVKSQSVFVKNVNLIYLTIPAGSGCPIFQAKGSC